MKHVRLTDIDLGFRHGDPAHTDFQYLEDLACAYWYSQVLFTALELEIFKFLDRGVSDLAGLAAKTSCDTAGLSRLLRAMARMALVISDRHQWYNTQVSSAYLVPGRKRYMGDFLLYRKYMRPHWENLTRELSRLPAAGPEKMAYKDRNFLYVRAMDTLVRRKSGQLADLLGPDRLTGPVLDVGGGAGSMIRALFPDPGHRDAVLFDLDETLAAAGELFADPQDWKGIRRIGGDFRSYGFEERFGTILLSNFLHAYGPEEAPSLLKKAAGLLKPGGRLVIHDYFPDRHGVHPQKGALYDLAMMLNTYNGACHECRAVTAWLEELGMAPVETADLDTDTSVIVAGGHQIPGLNRAPWVDWAAETGFDRCADIAPADIVTAPWVQLKCRFGCRGYGSSLQCPPHTIPYHETRTLLDSYAKAVLVQGAPPGKIFHDKLLALEKKAFLQGFPKALVFGAGPCPVCPPCPDDGTCRNHKKARPAMESCGIDVYSTAENAGIFLKPVKEKGQYVKYMGLLLLE